LLDGESCFELIAVQQRGLITWSTRFQTFIAPSTNFTCNGRITGVTASMNRVDSGATDPYVELWHPTTPDGDAFTKVDSVQLVDSEVVEKADNNNNTYWLVNMTLNESNRIEFEAGDFIGYYRPPNTRYHVWSSESPGNRVFGYEIATPLSDINLTGKDISFNNRQLLIQFAIGKNSVIQLIIVDTYIFVDIRCDILSTLSNGNMSCSSGRVGVGYEGDTCSFTCNTGYELTGSDNRICQSDGSWSGSDAVCRKGKYSS